MDIGDIQQQNAQLFTSMGKCLQHLRMLKSIVLNAHNVLACNSLGENATEQPQTFEKIKESIDKYAQQMNSEYEKLEAEAKMLPSQTPNSLMVNKLNNFLLDCAINPQMKETYSNTRNVFSWSESTGNFIDFAYHLFKIGNIQPLTQQRNRKLTLAHKWNVQNEQQSAQIQQMRADPSNQQSKFMDYFFDFMRQNRPFKIPDLPYEYKIVHNVLERSILHSVIELKYFAVPKSRTSDGQMVCLQKFLLFINNGIIEYVHFMAPHEDWKYEQFPGIGNRKQIDLSVSSRFELYQKLTIYGNMLCQNIVTMLGNNVNNVASPKFMTIVFGQFARCIIIDQTCLRCRKKLRDFSTVTAFDHHSKAHAACK